MSKFQSSNKDTSYPNRVSPFLLQWANRLDQGCFDQAKINPRTNLGFIKWRHENGCRRDILTCEHFVSHVYYKFGSISLSWSEHASRMNGMSASIPTFHPRIHQLPIMSSGRRYRTHAQLRKQMAFLSLQFSLNISKPHRPHSIFGKINPPTGWSEFEINWLFLHNLTADETVTVIWYHANATINSATKFAFWLASRSVYVNN